MNKEIIIALCAGEASGDLLGAHLIEALKQQYTQIRFVGIGGPRMKAAGLISLYEQDSLAVRGYVEILGNLSEILRIRRGLTEDLRKISPHVFVGIDAPNFNLPIAAKLKAAGIPTLHYVSPSVWAWKPERVHKIVKQVNKVLCLFPMEPKLYREAGGQAEYVGHPLAQMLPLENSREAVRERLKLNLTIPVFTLLPGSRVSEVEYMAPIFLRAAALIMQALPESVFLMPYPSAPVRECLQGYLQRDEFRYLPIRLQAAKTELACIAADVVLVTSGTAALEVALCKRPMVISYRVSRLTYSLVKRKLNIPYVGLPNILLEREVVPELLQHDATPEKLASTVLDWYYHPARADELEKVFLQLHRRLRRNTDELVAYAVLSEAGLSLPKPNEMGEPEETPIHEPEAADVSSTTWEAQSVTQLPLPSLAVSAPSLPETKPVPDETVVAAPNYSADVEAATPMDEQAATPESFRQPEDHPTTTPSPSPSLPNESDHMNMNANKPSTPRQSHEGLFGWFLSLFGKKQPEFEVVNDDVVPIVDDEPVIKNDLNQAAQPASAANPQPETPIRHVIEEEELHAAPVQMTLPKSTLLANHHKPNIFAKYVSNDAKPSTTTTAESVEPAVQPHIAVPSSHHQQATPVMSVPVAATATHTESVSQAEPVVSTVSPKTSTTSTSSTAGSLVKYLTQASMAGLPSSTLVKSADAPPVSTMPSAMPPVQATQSETPVHNQPPTAAVPVAHNPEPETKSKKPLEPVVVNIVVQPKSDTSDLPDAGSLNETPVSEQDNHATVVANKTIATPVETANTGRKIKISVVAPVLDMPKVAKPAVESTPVVEPIVETAVEPTATVDSITETAVEPTPTVEPVVETSPPATQNVDTNTSPFALKTVGENSFASVFRKHTLQQEQAENIDTISDSVEPDESDSPDQIVLNRATELSSPPTHADAATEEGLPPAGVSKYSTNPNHYNSGIFF